MPFPLKLEQNHGTQRGMNGHFEMPSFHFNWELTQTEVERRHADSYVLILSILSSLKPKYSAECLRTHICYKFIFFNLICLRSKLPMEV